MAKLFLGNWIKKAKNERKKKEPELDSYKTFLKLGGSWKSALSKALFKNAFI